METSVLTELTVLSIATVALGTLLGFLSHRLVGILLVGLPTGLACGLGLAGFRLYGWTGLLTGVLISAVLGYFLGSMFGRHRGGLFVAFLWLGYCASCAIGYWAARWLGWLTITLPSVTLFWYSLWRFSGRLLPIEIPRRSWWLPRDLLRRIFRPQDYLDPQMQWQRHHRLQSFRALLTYSFGTNYPYYVVEGGLLEMRADGNPFGWFFAGPGITINEPHQATVVSDGMEIKGIGPPGPIFTDTFNRIDQIVDLRTHVKVSNIEALTKDGIHVEVLAFVLFKIRATSQCMGEFWVDGESEEAVFQAVQAARMSEEPEKWNWDDLPAIRASLILTDIIAEYEFDDLLPRDLPAWYPHEGFPHEVIRRTLTARLTEAMARECEGIEIIDVEIANPRPVDPRVMQQGIANWCAEWERTMMIQGDEGAPETLRRASQARAQAQAEVIRILSRETAYVDSVDRDIVADVLTRRLLEALEGMARRLSVQQLLPPEVTKKIEYLRREMGKVT